MQGNIQIEVLNANAVRIVEHLKDVSDFDKQVIVMSLASSLDFTPTDMLLTSIMYPISSTIPSEQKTDL